LQLFDWKITIVEYDDISASLLLFMVKSGCKTILTFFLSDEKEKL